MDALTLVLLLLGLWYARRLLKALADFFGGISDVVGQLASGDIRITLRQADEPEPCPSTFDQTQGMNTAQETNSILLHACCGPCSITPVLRLQDLGLAPTLYFFNPNIHPLTEYLRRREGLLAVAERLGVPVILPDQDEPAAADPAGWLASVAALGPSMADMALRCPICYDLRLGRAARAARLFGFTRFSTTLLYSKYQNHQAILDAGNSHAGQGLDFQGEDFRPGWNEGIRLSKEWGIYRQPYCGCLLSEHDRYRKAVPLKT